MMYAMVKKVVNPARSSVVNLAFLISLGFDSQYFMMYRNLEDDVHALTREGGSTCPRMKQTPHR
jgi:hypothetical protein